MKQGPTKDLQTRLGQKIWDEGDEVGEGIATRDSDPDSEGDVGTSCPLGCSGVARAGTRQQWQ